jgi:hypothetical protein
MNIRLIALMAAVLPFVAVHLTYLLAASYGLVDWCVPYIDSCTSISATGRHPPASYLFRALMLPSAVIMMAYWWLNHVWLLSLHDRAGHTRRLACHWMLALGVVAGIGLIIYVTVLGEPGSLWARQRRIGTVLFFSLTYIAQLILLWQLRRLRSYLPQVPALLPQAMFCLCLLLLGLGLLTVLLDAWDEVWYNTVDDAFEWVLALLLQSNFLLGYFVWRYARWQLQVSHPTVD